MNDLINRYENAKRNAIQFMKKGQINAYFESLLEINRYERLMLAVVAN